MIDDLIRQLFEKETDRILEGIGRRIPAESAKAAVAGTLTSGGYPSVVYDMVIEGLHEAAENRVEIEKTVWHRQTKKPGPADANACKAAIASSIEQVIPRFFSIIEEACRTAQLPQLVSHFRQLFYADKTRFLSEAERDVDSG